MSMTCDLREEGLIIRKVLNCIIILSTLFFSVYSILVYSYQPYESIHSNVTALEIESEQIVANEVFTNRLIAVCDAAKCDIFYETIKDEASYCPTYCIYKTNINEDFLSLPLTHRDNCLLYGDEYITTDYSDNKAVDTIIGIKLLQNIEISSLQRVNGRILNGSVFYADNNHVDDLKRELIENGFQVAILSNQFIEGDNQWNLAVAFFYVILLVTILLYFLSIGKEIVIKKVCGYSNLLIFQEKFRSILFTVLMVIVFETCTIIAIFFKDLKSICHFIQYMQIPAQLTTHSAKS